MERTQKSSNKQSLHPHGRTLLRDLKEQTNTQPNSEAQGHHANGQKLEPKSYTMSDSIYVTLWRSKTESPKHRATFAGTGAKRRDGGQELKDSFRGEDIHILIMVVDAQRMYSTHQITAVR